LNKRHQWKGLWEQDILTDLLKRRKEVKISKQNIYNLPKFYNYCIYKFTHEQELQDWDKIKVLHYWYRSGNKPDPKRRSWRVWLGEKIMAKGNPTLVDEIKRLKEIYSKKPRLNARKIGLLDHLLEFSEYEVRGRKKGESKSFEELETEKEESMKQEKKRKSTKKKDEE